MGRRLVITVTEHLELRDKAMIRIDFPPSCRRVEKFRFVLVRSKNLNIKNGDATHSIPYRKSRPCGLFSTFSSLRTVSGNRLANTKRCLLYAATTVGLLDIPAKQ
jgi:hypothetical protein